VLSEESAPIDDQERLSWSTYWLVDPLDGTKEFLNRNGEFTVNIALIEDNVPSFGIVHVPVEGLTYVGQAKKGAFRLDAAHTQVSLHVAEQASDPLRILGSRSHPAPDLDEYLTQQGPFIMAPVGSSLKFCRVAEGSADLYPRFGPTSEWDTAAGQAVLESAGGRVVDLQGYRLRYNLKTSLLNPYFLAFGDLSRDWLPRQSGP
jgi:3'(2'), 5'-bisphosphate nucleotidase